MAHTFTNLLTHVVFSTKDREPSIVPDLREELLAYMGGIVRGIRGKALVIGGTADHVHLLIELAPATSIAEAARVIKANSSKWVHETQGKYSRFAWQTGYGAFSVSRSNRDAVSEYIRSQEEHHRRIPFKEEFLAILRKHGIEFDERYIWD
jgi:REP element-mobilizing transposase RayT